MSSERAAIELRAAYRAECLFRRRQFQPLPQTLQSIGQLARILTEADPMAGVMLCGLYGNGKTTLLYALENLTQRLVRDGRIGKCQLLIRRAKEISKAARNEEAFRALMQQRMLAVEDLGTEPAEILEYGNVLSPVVDLLEYRYDKQLFTVVTTNLTPEEIKQHYGPRIADRLREMMARIIFTAPSFRTSTPEP